MNKIFNMTKIELVNYIIGICNTKGKRQYSVSDLMSFPRYCLMSLAAFYKNYYLNSEVKFDSN